MTYAKVLIPTDGSALSTAAALKGIELAKRLGAAVVTFYAPATYQYPIYLDVVPSAYLTEGEYKQVMRKTAAQYLSTVEQAAQVAGVKCESDWAFDNAPADAIVKIAKRKGCDLIVMGSHGRTGVEKLFLGSVANKVLTTCTIPVLVHRATKAELTAAERLLKKVAKEAKTA